MATFVKGKGLGSKPNATYLLWEYDSLFEFADAANANPKKQSSNRWDGHYNLTGSFDEAYELCKSGWHDIRPTVDGHLEPLRERLGQTLGVSTVRTLDIVGYEPNIDLYLAGEMDCMWDDMMVEAPKTGKVFTMVVDVSMTFGNNSADIAKRGAVLCGLVEAFIMLGFQLELWVEVTNYGDKGPDEYATRLVRVNRAGELIDIDSIMFAIGHPDFNRRLMWSHAEAQPDMAKHYGFHSGGYYGLNRCGSHMADRVGASMVVSLDGNSEMTRDPLAWILGQLEMQGIWQGDA